MKNTILLICLIASITSFGQEKEHSNKAAILQVLKAQEIAWSQHNLEGYMEGYWKSDSLKFYGSNGLTYGWNKTLSNYKKGYPRKEHTGTLKFKVNAISKISKIAYFVMGEYHLTRKIGNARGFFMIIFKKIKGKWKIIADTSA